MFKVNNKNTRTKLTYFTPFSSVSIFDFEQKNICWVLGMSMHKSCEALFLRSFQFIKVKVKSNHFLRCFGSILIWHDFLIERVWKQVQNSKSSAYYFNPTSVNTLTENRIIFLKENNFLPRTSIWYIVKAFFCLTKYDNSFLKYLFLLFYWVIQRQN